MSYAASKLWNICNYERKNYKILGIEYPDWYEQKARLKDNIWFKSLPSQTAQEVCKQLDGAWRSFYKLKETGSILKPKPPRFKHSGIPVTYMQNGIKRINNHKLRLSLPSGLKEFLAAEYDIHETYLFLENTIFQDVDIKQLKIYPPEEGKIKVIIIYEVPDIGWLPDNGHYLSCLLYTSDAADE